MDFRSLFIAMGVVFIGVLSVFGYLNNLNDVYGTDVGGSMNQTKSEVSLMLSSNLSRISQDVTGNLLSEEGGDPGSGNDGLITRSLNILQSFYSLFTLAPTVVYEASVAIGVPPALGTVAKWMIGFVEVITFAFVLLLGIRRLF